MEPSTIGLDRAIAGQSVRLAVFDVAIRRHVGQWQTTDPVDIQEVIDRFATIPDAQLDDGRILLPLHDDGSANPTGEVVIADRSTTPPRIEFYDFSANAQVTHSIDELTETPIAWRLRFWTSAFQPDDPPGFLEEAGVTAPAPEPTAATVPGRDDEPTEWIDTIRSALVDARDAQRNIRRQAYHGDPDADSIADGGGIAGLECAGRHVDDYGQQVVTLRLPDGEQADTTDRPDLTSAALAEGDDVLVVADAPGLPVEAALFDLEPDRVELGVYWDTAAGDGVETALDAETDGPFGIVPLVEAAPYETVEQALRSIARRDRVQEVFAGTGTLRFEDPPDVPAFDGLNRDQERAIERALGAEDVCCVAGPPWTGTRRTIHAMVDACISADRTVGLFAPTVDALERLIGTSGASESVQLSTGRSVEYAPLGSATRSDADAWEADVIGIALEESIQGADLALDVGIVDQAARVDVARAAIPFEAADRIVLVGDSNQLPPERPLTGETDAVPRSIFAHISASYDEAATISLRCQYAMNQAIAMYSNARYYGGRLIHGQRNRTWTIDTLAPLHPVQADGTPRRSPTGSWHHEGEVSAVMAELDALTERGVTGGNIGIIAPTSAQVGKIRAALDERGRAEDGIIVGPPEALACGGREAIILSLLAAPDGGHAWSSEALNVAMTRAKRRLVVVANWHRLTDDDAPAASDPALDLAAFFAERGLLPGES